MTASLIQSTSTIAIATVAGQLQGHSVAVSKGWTPVIKLSFHQRSGSRSQWWPYCRNQLLRSTSSTADLKLPPTLSVIACVLLPLLLVLVCWPIAVVDAKVFSTQMSQRIVTTRYGRLRGILVELPDRTLPTVEAYLGIEYASLIGGELRFLPPTSPVTRWDGVRTALKFKPVCPQQLPDLDELSRRAPADVVGHIRRILPFLERQQEDCLYLNIYVPVRDKNDTSLLPVVMFVHGETFDTGTGNAYDGSVLAAFGHVIVITVNYRLGVLGFLSTGDVHAPGNYALLDLVAALHWIADSIRAFGGDPSTVSLMGQGVGGAMVNMLMLSPTTRGRRLFRRAIIHSGSALSSWAVAEDAPYYTRRLADRLNCTGATASTTSASTSTSARQTVLCLRRQSVDRLVQAAAVDPAPRYLTVFGPVVNPDGGGVLRGSGGIQGLLDRACERSSGGLQPRRPVVGSGQDQGDADLFPEVDLLVGVTNNEGYEQFSQNEIDAAQTSRSSSVVPSSSSSDDVDAHVENDEDEEIWRRTLRTYVFNNFRYHQQTIYDVLDHNYGDFESESETAVAATASVSGRAPSKSKPKPRPSLPPSADVRTSTNWTKPTWWRRRYLDAAVELISDGQHVAPAVGLAMRHSSCGPSPASTYLYRFGIQPPSPPPASGSSLTSTAAAAAGTLGCYHSRQLLAYVFGAPLADGLDPFPAHSSTAATAAPAGDDGRTQEEEIKLAEVIMGYWSHFIRTGNPNSLDSMSSLTGKRSTVVWPQYNEMKQEYMQLGNLPSSVRHHLKSRKVALWLDLLPRLHRPDDIDDALHLLDDHDNETTYDDPLALRRLTPLRPSTVEPPPAASRPTSVEATPTPPSSNVSSRSTPTRRAVTTSAFGHMTTASTTMAAAEPEATDGTGRAASSSSGVGGNNAAGPDESGKSTLIRTITVGCGLLFINVAVFFAIMCQWRGLRRARMTVNNQRAKGLDGVGLGHVTTAAVPCSARENHFLSSSAAVDYDPPSPLLTMPSMREECTCTRDGVVDDKRLLGNNHQQHNHHPPSHHHHHTHHKSSATMTSPPSQSLLQYSPPIYMTLSAAAAMTTNHAHQQSPYAHQHTTSTV